MCLMPFFLLLSIFFLVYFSLYPATLCTVEKSEFFPEVADSPEVEEAQIVQPVSQSNEESESKPEAEQEENGNGSQITFDYERLKAKSDNPVTGIDFKQREVGDSRIFQLQLLLFLFLFLIARFLLSGISL